MILGRGARMAVAMSGLALASGCTYVGTFDERNFVDLPIAAKMKVRSRAVILTTAEQDDEVYAGRPETFVGSADTFVLPVGRIAREAALRIFGELFEGGAISSQDPAASGVVISPRVTSVSYRFEGLGGTLVLGLSVSVHARDADEAPLLEKTYESGRVVVKPSRIGEPVIAVFNRAAHQEVQWLLLKAAEDLRAEILQRNPAKPPIQ